MERILTSKKVVERNLSIVKHINDKYVLFKDENKMSVDDSEPISTSFYGVTTIDQLMGVRYYEEVPYLINVADDKKKVPYTVMSIPSGDLEKLKKGAIHFGNYDFPWGIEENLGDDMVYVLVRTYDFTMRDMDEKLIPLPISLNYIDEKYYDLDKVLEIIKANPSRFVTSGGADASLIKIHNIPYYNADEDRTKYIDCKYLPTDEEYWEYVYGKHYLRYDKIVDKWFSECKKKVTE